MLSDDIPMELQSAVRLFLIILSAYLLGSIPFGLVFTKFFASEDIRNSGSGNIGATNVTRVAGLGPGVLTLAGDIIKGALPVYSAVAVTGTGTVWGRVFVSAVAFSAFWGHLYPVYMKFRGGGKGVATAAGCFCIISPVACFVGIFCFIITVFCCKRVSAGSLAGTAVMPFAVWGDTRSLVLTGCAALVVIIIYCRHIENIKRLISGTEPVFSKTKEEKNDNYER